MTNSNTELAQALAQGIQQPPRYPEMLVVSTPGCGVALLTQVSTTEELVAVFKARKAAETAAVEYQPE